nr:rifin PIR protein,putative [Plasmodium sp. DRC-Itaito]
MKVHYINILLFALPLNILVKKCHVNTHKKPSITQHTPKVPTTRFLCECELYAPANYDNDPQMKEVMQQFEDRTSERLRDYDDRMVEKRKQCKEHCDKEIQKIILKDKLEKELMDKFVTLDTDIQSDAIPTCVCETSLADKVEKGCLRCGGVLGGGVAPGVGILGGIGEAIMSSWKPVALKAAARYAAAKGAAEGLAAGHARVMDIVIHYLEHLGVEKSKASILNAISSTGEYASIKKFAAIIEPEFVESCKAASSSAGANNICMRVNSDPTGGTIAKKYVSEVLNTVVNKAPGTAKETAAQVSIERTAAIQAEQTDLIHTICVTWDTTIIASVVTIVVIILIMVIIYLILRHRRKKKMKKKLQYIKLLEE